MTIGWRRLVRILVVGLVAANLGFHWWLTRVLTFERPQHPGGQFVIAFPTHGTTEYITVLEGWLLRSFWIIHVLAAVLWLMSMMPASASAPAAGTSK